MGTQMGAYNIPGAAVAIVREGEVEYLGSFGVANPRGQLVTPDTPFLLASLSKSITAVGVMQLVEAGQINLDDPVQNYLPWFEVSEGQGGEITVAHLLYQTSGFSELDGIQATLRPDSPDALEEGVRDLAVVDLSFSPGEDWEYSNLNYNTLGLLIQEVSGQSFESYIQEHIFDPLGMTHSYISLLAARDGGAASGYYPFFGFPLVYDNFMPYSRATLPSGGLWSSASDMGRYLIAQLNDGRYGATTLLSPDSVRQLHQPGAEIEPGFRYAMGWSRANGFLDRDFLQTLGSDLNDHDDLVTLFHEGDWANYKSVALLLPGLNYGAVVLMNSNDPTASSALRFFAWDVTLLATGGEAQYFPPAEGFLVRYSRWIFALVALLLIAEMVWSMRKWRRIRRRDVDIAPDPGTMLFHAGIPFVIDVALVAYLLFRLLPDNAVNLPILIKNTPDLGLLTILILLLTVGWGALRTTLFGYAWMKWKGTASSVGASMITESRG